MGAESTKAHSYAEALREMTHRHESLVQDLSILRQLDEVDDPGQDFDAVCQRLTETVASGLAIENCSLMLVDDEGAFVELRAVCSPFEEKGKSFASGEWRGKRFRLGEGIVGKVVESGESVRVDDTTQDEAFVFVKGAATEVRSLLCIPLSERERVLGVLNLSHSRPGFFSVESENTLALVAGRAARILSNHLLHQQLRSSEEHYRLVTENAADGILVFDGDGRCVGANAAVLGIAGTAPEQFSTGKENWESGIHHGDRERYTNDRECLLESREPSMVDYRRLDAAGEVHHLEQRSSPLVNAAGRLTGIVSVVRDVTDRKRAEEETLALERQVQHAQKLESLGVLAGGIAHDFNNILAAVVGYADLAMVNLSETHPALPCVREIVVGANRAADLTRQMLAYSGRGKFVVETLDMSALMDDMAHLLRTSIARTISLNLDLERSLPPVKADTAQMQQVIMNLITNAADAIDDDYGTITLSTGVRECGQDYLARNLAAPGSPEDAPLPGTYVCLAVSDTGCGMDKETEARLFEPFFTTKSMGRGLGMAAVLGIVRGHKGALILDTEPGSGSTFRLLLPAAKDKSPSVAKDNCPAPDTQDGLRRGMILVVDDEEPVRNLTTAFLERMGFSALTAADGREAVGVFREHADEIACVFLDLTMPLMGGQACIEALRQIRGDIKVIVMSGYSEQEAIEHFPGQIPTGFLHKPFRLDELKEKIEEILREEP